MHNFIKYVKYAEYGLTLYLHNLGLWLCAAVEICKILLVLHNILYVCGSMPQCPAASGRPSSDCVTAIDPGSRPVDSSSDASLSFAQVLLLQSSLLPVISLWFVPCTYIAHTCSYMFIHVHTVYIHLSTLYMGTTDFLHIPLHYMPACTALVTWMYYAIMQEPAFWYIQISVRDIAFKVGLKEVSAFL